MVKGTRKYFSPIIINRKYCRESDDKMNTQRFYQTLSEKGLCLERKPTTVLQINVGLKCNQTCKHCHLEAGPKRTEMMTRNTMDDVIAFATNHNFEIIDITGGAPELHPDLPYLIDSMTKLAPQRILRSNLTVLAQKGETLISFLASRKVTVAVSFPSLNVAQTEAIRGKDIFQDTIRTLQLLNAYGYGKSGTGLELNMVVNPSGAVLPSPQAATEKRYRQVLKDKWGIEFNNLFCFANVPLGRFKSWLKRSGNYEAYLNRLAQAFNPAALENVMCRNLISVAWDGCLYDCDFNQAADLPLSKKRIYISDIKALPTPGSNIAVGDHCYTCTAGSGFT